MSVHRIDTMRWNKNCLLVRDLLNNLLSWRMLKLDNLCCGSLKLHCNNDKYLLTRSFIYTMHTYIHGNVTWLYQTFTWCVSDVTGTGNVILCMSLYTISSNDGNLLLTACSYSPALIWWSLALAFSFVRLEITLADSDMFVRCVDSCVTCEHYFSSHTCTYCKWCKLASTRLRSKSRPSNGNIFFRPELRTSYATPRHKRLSQGSVDLGFNSSLCFLSYRVRKREITCYWKAAVKQMRPQQVSVVIS
jgi:hypothetical protein